MRERTISSSSLFTGPKCKPKLRVHSNSAPYGDYFEVFAPENVLTNGCEFRDDIASRSNYFIGKQEETTAFLVLDAGCNVFMTDIVLKNVHNVHNNK